MLAGIPAAQFVMLFSTIFTEPQAGRAIAFAAAADGRKVAAEGRRKPESNSAGLLLAEL